MLFLKWYSIIILSIMLAVFLYEKGQTKRAKDFVMGIILMLPMIIYLVLS